MGGATFRRGSTEFRALVWTGTIAASLCVAVFVNGQSGPRPRRRLAPVPTGTPGFIGPTPTMPVPCGTPLSTPIVWSGNGATTNFSDNLNWATPTPGDPGAPFVFPSGPTNTIGDNDLVGLLPGSILIDGNTAYSLGGNSMSLLTGDLTIGAQTTTADHVLNFPLVLPCDAIVTVSQAFGGVFLNGGVSGPKGIVKTGLGYLVFSSDIGVGGQVNVVQGTLLVRPGAVLGYPGTSLSSGANLEFQASLNVPLPNFLNAAGGSRIQVDNGSNDVFDSTVNFFNGSTNVVMGDSTSLTFNGPVRGNGALNITAAAGTVTVNNYEPGPSPAFVAGLGTTLVFNGTYPNSDVTLNGATLLGAGSFRTLNVAGGTVSPGQSPGILSPGGGATFSGSSTLISELNGTVPGTGHDQLNVTGAVALGAGTTALNVAVGYVPTVGDTYPIVQASGGLTGTFMGLPDNATFGVGGQFFRINYTATTVVLTALGTTPVELQNFRAD